MIIASAYTELKRAASFRFPCTSAILSTILLLNFNTLLTVNKQYTLVETSPGRVQKPLSVRSSSADRKYKTGRIPFSNSYHDGGLDVFRTAQGRRIFFVPFGAIAAPSPPFRDSQANHPIRRPGSRRSRVLPGIYQVTVSISAIDVARCDLGLVWKMEFVWRTFLALLACTIAMR